LVSTEATWEVSLEETEEMFRVGLTIRVRKIFEGS
jgi:hypothetical protein